MAAKKRTPGISKPRVDLLRLELIASEAKRANQRLRELEKQGLTQSPDYQQVRGLFYSMDIVEGTDIFGKTSKGQIKFRTDIRRLAKESPEKLALLETRLAEFMGGKESTVTGVKKMQAKLKAIGDNMRKKYGRDFSEEEIRRLLRHEQMDNRLKKYMDSDERSELWRDVEEGRLTEADLAEYLDRVEAGEFGFKQDELYSYHSMVSDVDWEAPW